MMSGTATATPEGSPRRRSRRRRILVLLAGVVLVAGLVWASAIGYIASTTLMYGDAEKHGCPTPAELGWAYEAVNYDIALDEQLPDDNPNWLTDCPNHGAGTAGTDVVSADGVRLAGWYIPSGDGDAASAPTVVIVHGWGVSKSDALRYAVPLHDTLEPAPHRHTSSGSQQRRLDVLRRSPRPPMFAPCWTGSSAPSGRRRSRSLGDSGGRCGGGQVGAHRSRGSPVWCWSRHMRAFGTPSSQQFGAEQPLFQPVALTLPITMAAFWARTGAWLGDADPLDAIADLGRPTTGDQLRDEGQQGSSLS